MYTCSKEFVQHDQICGACMHNNTEDAKQENDKHDQWYCGCMHAQCTMQEFIQLKNSALNMHAVAHAACGHKII